MGMTRKDCGCMTEGPTCEPCDALRADLIRRLLDAGYAVRERHAYNGMRHEFHMDWTSYNNEIGETIEGSCWVDFTCWDLDYYRAFFEI